MKSRLAELCRKAADGAREAIVKAGTPGHERGGTRFFQVIEDLDGDVGCVSVALLGGAKGQAVELEALGKKVVGSFGKVKREQEELLAEYEARTPALLAEELRGFLTKFLKAGATRDDIVYQLDVAVAESVMDS